MFVTGLVLAAGASRRLGLPKQLLPYRGATLLDATLAVVRSCGFDQVVVALGGSGALVRASVDLNAVEVVQNTEYASGCSSSIRTALSHIDQRADGLVLMLGDQPGVSPAAVAELTRDPTAAMSVCRYSDGWGHPVWFRNDMFADLRQLHGDKGIWRLLHERAGEVREAFVDGPVPLDVDTWPDFAALVASDAQDVPE